MDCSGILTTVDISSNNVIKNKKVLMLGTGGIKGIAHLGVLKAMNEYNILNNIDEIVGISVGAFIAVALVSGMNVADMIDLLMLFDISKIVNPQFEHLEKYGLDDGRNIIIFMKKILSTVNIGPDITFKQLYNLTKKKLIIVATCLNTQSTESFAYDTHPDMSVLLAMRMSISIPIYFTPVTYNNKLYVDGACTDSFPIHLYGDRLDEVIAVHLSDAVNEYNNITSLEDYLLNVVGILIKTITHTNICGFEKHIIRIVSKKFSVLNPALTLDDKQYLLDLGYNAFIKKYGVIK